MRMCLVILLAMGCGSPQSNVEPLERGQRAPATEPAEPAAAEPAEPTEPTRGPVEPGDSNGPVIAYAIDGTLVDEATFNALFERLDVDDEAYEGETVVEPDGSYGGAGESFHARDGDVSYRYDFSTYPRADGREGQGRMLTRE